MIDSDSFWIDGYFEETKMARVCIGDRAEAQLVGYAKPILGHVKTVTRGISVSNAAAGTQGLPSVDPIYTWARLAQRVPVRVAIDTVPPDVPLVSGMTATVTIRQPAASDRQTRLDRFRAGFFLLPAVRQDRQKPRQRVAGCWMLRAARVMTAATSFGCDS